MKWKWEILCSQWKNAANVFATERYILQFWGKRGICNNIWSAPSGEIKFCCPMTYIHTDKSIERSSPGKLFFEIFPHIGCKDKNKRPNSDFIPSCNILVLKFIYFYKILASIFTPFCNMLGIFFIPLLQHISNKFLTMATQYPSLNFHIFTAIIY